MKTLIPILVLLAAGASTLLNAGCNPPPDLTPITRELASLRKEVEELRKADQPKFDTEQAMEDLAKEVRRLRDRLSQPAPAPAAPAPAPAALPQVLQAATLSGSVGGTQPNVHDLYWVLGKVLVDKEERTTLALYQAQDGGRGFRLLGVRMLNADLQVIEMGNDKPRVKDIVDALRKK